jgi:hypothetical protein
LTGYFNSCDYQQMCPSGKYKTVIQRIKRLDLLLFSSPLLSLAGECVKDTCERQSPLMQLFQTMIINEEQHLQFSKEMVN